MDPVRAYDYLALSRGRILDRARTLSPEQYVQTFDVGPGSLSKIFTHLLISEWYYIERIESRDVPPYGDAWPFRDEQPLPLHDLEREWSEQIVRTRESLASVTDWDARISYRITLDTGVTEDVRASKGDVATQLALHEVHHRSQAMHILRRLGAPLDDIDYNVLMYDRRPVGGAH
jgi:uncharacterized damage-inducible protein DinB